MGDLSGQINVDPQSGSREGFWRQLWESTRQRTGTYLITAVFAFLAVFSDSIAGRIKFELNKADYREDKYATLSRDLSGYIFDCQLVAEYLRNGLTSKEGLTPLAEDYNKDITELRRNEFVERAYLAKYWGKDRQAEYASIMTDVLQIDTTVHSLNDEIEQVVILKKKDKIDPTKAKATADELEKMLSTFKPKAEKLLVELE
jgi:hypothetical protein